MRLERVPAARLLEGSFLGLGILLLGSWLVIEVDARLFQDRNLEIATASESAPDHSTPANAVAPNSVIGRIDIPRLGLSAVVTEGTDAPALLRAVGHLPGTALPGRPGNIVLAGHRDTYFRPLARIAPNDTICVATPHGRYAYRVIATQIVPPSQAEVLSPSPTPRLTLVTCYPFHYIGRAPLRFIVQAEEVKSPSRS